MKIIFLARRFAPDIGGVEKHVMEVSKELVGKGHKVSVITESKGRTRNIQGIKIIRLPLIPNGWFKKFHLWKWVIRNREVFSDADIIHAHDVYFWYFPLRILMPFRKSFVTFHGYESYPVSKKAIFVRKLSEIMADGNICVGEFMKKWYRTDPAKVIYGGVRLMDKYSESTVLNSAVFIGRLDEHTGILDYAEAVDIIRKEYPDFKFKIVGDGKYLGRLKRFMPLGFRNDPISVLEKYNFAFVSRYLSILEALSQKRLVFALYDNPVKEDYLKMTPFRDFIIISENPDELAEKVHYFLKNPTETKKLIDSGYNWVKDKSWENVASVYLNLWREKQAV